MAEPALGQQAPCRFTVETDGSAAADEAAEQLRRDVDRLGLCRRPWVVKLSQAQRRSYTIALWTGSDLETRSTNDADQIVPVSQLLLRVAVERAGPPPEPPPEPPPAPPAPAPPAAEPASRGLLGFRLGPIWSERAGWGVDGGFEAGLERGLLRWSLAPHASWVRDTSEARVTLRLPLRLGFHETSGPGAFVELGPAWQHVGETSTGAPADARWGLGMGAGVSFTHAIGDTLRWHVALPVRYDLFSTDANELPAPTPVDPPGNSGGNSNNSGKKRPPTVESLSEAARNFGGLSIGLQVGITLPIF
ncbi:MAG TPA: hypothetical protein VFS43_47095 [Polyangiaceae bacterium]|nr:hypothetical protein [Polyangiaceae bacterium]